MKTILRSAFVLFFLAFICAFGFACDEESGDDGGGGQPAENPTPEHDVTLDLAHDLAKTWMRTYEPSQNAWSWDAGILMMGFMALSDAVKDESLSQYAKDWLDYYIETGYRIASSDTCVPGYTALLFFEKTGEGKYLRVADEVWTYISEKAGRTSDGGLNHMGWISGNQIWVDTLFMVGPFLLKYAEITGSSEPYEEFALQLRVFRNHLRNADYGLYLHRYDDDTGEILPSEPLLWGRGNGWVFVASNLAHNALPENLVGDLGYPLESDLGNMFEAIRGSEDESGRFHTILNRPDTYLETSAGLLYAWGLTIGMQGRHFFGREHLEDVDRWLQAAVDQIVTDEAGDTLILGTSYGTSPGGVEYYNQVLKGENVAYGIGLFQLLAVERERVGYWTRITGPVGATTEEYQHPPVPCTGLECGRFHISRGNYTRALDELEDVTEGDADYPEAQFWSSVVRLVRVVIGVVEQIDKLTIGDESFGDFLEWIRTEAKPAAQIAAEALAVTEAEADFSTVLPRLVILESGGSNALGSREFDLGEAHILRALASLIVGLADVLDGGNTDGIVAGLDELIAGIESIEAETDDQSDDLLPKNLFELTGTFSLPGILPETDVREMILGLGIPEWLLDSLDMPDDLIRILTTLQNLIALF